MEISSVGFFLTEMGDHTGLSHTEDEITRGLFDAFSRYFVREGEFVYGILRCGFREEYIARIDELRKSGVEFVNEKEAARKIGLFHRLLYWKIDARTIYAKDIAWEDLSRWYRESDTWRSTCFIFLISPVVIDGWIKELAKIGMGTIDKVFLRRTGRILFNQFEHGMETVGPPEPTEPLEKIALELSQKFNLTLQVREK